MKIDEKGFMLLSAVFLTLIVSFVAMLTFQSMTRVKNSDASLELQAINLANEQFALIESGSDKKIPDEDLKNYGLYYEGQDSEDNADYKPPIVFEVETNISGEGNLKEVEVIVIWKEQKLSFKKLIRLNS